MRIAGKAIWSNNAMTHSKTVRAVVTSLITAGALIFVCFSTATASAGGKTVTVPTKAGGAGIQQALDRLPDGGVVVLEAGTYLIHEPVMLQRDGQTLRGAGPATILFLANKANCPVVVLGSPVIRPDGPITGVVVSDLMIDGNRKNQGPELWRSVSGGDLYNNGIDVWNVNGAAVERVICCRCRSGGLVSTAQTRRLTVNNFTAFDNQFDGLACYSTEESLFSRLDLHDNLAAGISLDGDFSHNVIDGAVLTHNDLGIFMRQSRNNRFIGITINKSRHHGVFMAQTGDDRRLLPGTECTGNTFDNLLVTECGGGAFWVNNDSCIGNRISNSRFLDNAQGGLCQARTNPVTARDLVERDTTTTALGVLAPTLGKPAGHETVARDSVEP
jgi:polygalacturonase